MLSEILVKVDNAQIILNLEIENIIGFDRKKV